MNMNMNMMQNLQNIQNLQNLNLNNQNSYNNNLNNSNIHNNSNSTDELFASINKKIDNLNTTTMTQNSFIGASKNDVTTLNPYSNINPYLNNFNSEGSMAGNITGNIGTIGNIGNSNNNKMMNNNPDMNNKNQNMNTMSSMDMNNMNNFNTINNLNMNNINAMSKLKNFNNFNNFQDKERDIFPQETNFNNKNIMNNINNMNNNYPSGMPFLNEDYDDEQDNLSLNMNMNNLNINNNYSNVPLSSNTNSNNKFYNPVQLNQINKPPSPYNMNRGSHSSQNAHNSLPNFLNNNVSNQNLNVNKRDSKNKVINPGQGNLPSYQQPQFYKQNQTQTSLHKNNKNNQGGYSDLNDEEVARIAGIIAKDQSGCRFVQKRIMDNPHFANDILFYEIQTYMLDLINDAFGNYLVQKLIEYIDEDKVEWIINLIEPYFVEICSSPHGTRVIQKIIECLNTENLMIKFNTIFANSLLVISKDPNANHIVHKYVYTIKAPHNQFIYDIILANLVDVATDKHGCCVMQKLIDAGDMNQKVKNKNKFYFNKLLECTY
jgi:pumilio RNA-binding family